MCLLRKMHPSSYQGTVHLEPCFRSASSWILWMRSAWIWYKVLPLGSPTSYIPLGYCTPRRVPWPPASSRTPTRFSEIRKIPVNKEPSWAVAGLCQACVLLVLNHSLYTLDHPPDKLAEGKLHFYKSNKANSPDVFQNTVIENDWETRKKWSYKKEKKKGVGSKI